MALGALIICNLVFSTFPVAEIITWKHMDLESYSTQLESTTHVAQQSAFPA